MPKAKYSVSVDIAAKSKMANHARFLANVSVPAAERLRNAYYSALKSLEMNPATSAQKWAHWKRQTVI
ncbi:MAG: hypothetical protein FWH57_12690 [Oscillospiraceae bacterium]|nr:hypothetical protein [Oscillospiraceae bacterium]